MSDPQKTPESTKDSLFKQLYKAGKDFWDELKYPLEEKKAKRKFEAAHGDASMIIIEAQRSKNALRENVMNYDINKAIALSSEITNAEKTIELLKAEYLELFGEELK
jgi:hypothetical protein